ncbi:hypothetical protein [Actomonas aquatica]|uniref:Uncharacterized protein n=1 Tax=Actomonas aquatica TaxID=2866162 RepID=A0ABZ1C9R3_9BACT|nr:hypothetical protein [Opitutus sp. WL0086]WRQ88390.1 hypothetical protein K1X11_003175 [Opitutus sp. WL0086]
MVLDRLREKLPVDYEVLVHLWREEHGAKARGNYSFEVETLRSRSEICYLVEEPGHGRDDFPEIQGGSNSGSPPHNTMGMFLAIMHLIQRAREQSPPITHVLRIRTDCLIHDWDLPAWPFAVNLVADNPVLPRNWICDHLWLGPMEDFAAVWDFGSRERLVKEYLRARRNPERLLSQRLRRARFPVQRQFRRWVNYNIIYARPMDSDPPCLQEAVASREPAQLFSGADAWHDRQACEAYCDAIPEVPDHLATWNRFKQWCAVRMRR